MNRGSHRPQCEREHLSLCFNEAPIHESGKCNVVESAYAWIPALQ